jgi:ketosteroid isomerase-like protein
MPEVHEISMGDDTITADTTEVMRRFNDVFLRHDPSALPELIAFDCEIDGTTNGVRYVGREACVAQWTQIATTPGTHFDLEEVFVAGDRAIIRWRFWSNETTSQRGVNLMRVRDGQIVEGMGYVKRS